MNRRLLLVLLGSWLWITPAWCDKPPPVNAALDERLDLAVIEAVLKDLLSNKKSPLPAGLRNKRLLYGFAKPNRRLDAHTILDSSYEKAWKKLPQRRLADAQKAVTHLVVRAAGETSFPIFRSEDTRILFRSAEQAREDDSFDPIFRLYPPGYAADQQLAVVHLWFPWSIHSGVATYMLERRRDQWVIRIRQIIYYA